MQVRHNTQLLEQAIDLQVKRSAIPTLEAEAAAHDKIARANGFRRMATGAAVAVAAVGIGIGAMLIFGLDEPNSEKTTKVDERILDEGKTDWPGKTPAPAAPQPEQPRSDEPAPEAMQPELPEKPTTNPPDLEPNPKTFDFTKFVNQDVAFAGKTWTLTSGHHFADENSPSWDKAWCYTRLSVGGVDLNVELANRTSPDARPLGPVSPRETFTSVGLTEDQARELGARCPWLDNASFAPTDFDDLPGRAKAPAFVVEDGWDALGHDLPNMPVSNVSFQECQAQCESDGRCLAVTYNKAYSACFMKDDATVLVRSDQATMGAKDVVAGKITYSSLVFAKNTVVVGNLYTSTVAAGYGDCVMACASDQRCTGFNFDTNKLCTLLDAVISSSDFKGVASGVKANSN